MATVVVVPTVERLLVTGLTGLEPVVPHMVTASLVVPPRNRVLTPSLLCYTLVRPPLSEFLELTVAATLPSVENVSLVIVS